MKVCFYLVNFNFLRITYCNREAFYYIMFKTGSEAGNFWMLSLVGSLIRLHNIIFLLIYINNIVLLTYL